MVVDGNLTYVRSTDNEIEADDIYFCGYGMLFLNDGKLGVIFNSGAVVESIFELKTDEFWDEEKAVSIHDILYEKEQNHYSLRVHTNIGTQIDYLFKPTKTSDANKPYTFTKIKHKIISLDVFSSANGSGFMHFSIRSLSIGNIFETSNFYGTKVISSSYKKTGDYTTDGVGKNISNNVPQVQNYFTNVSNYNETTWGGAGAVKSGAKYLNTIPRNNLEKYNQMKAMLGEWAGGFGYGWIAFYPSKNGIAKSTKFTKEKSGDNIIFKGSNEFEIISASDNNHSKMFDEIFHSGKTITFMSPKVSYSKSGNDITINNCVDAKIQESGTIVIRGGVKNDGKKYPVQGIKGVNNDGKDVYS